MRKVSASDSDRDETVHSELSRGGYITEDDKVAWNQLPGASLKSV